MQKIQLSKTVFATVRNINVPTALFGIVSDISVSIIKTHSPTCTETLALSDLPVRSQDKIIKRAMKLCPWNISRESALKKYF